MGITHISGSLSPLPGAFCDGYVFGGDDQSTNRSLRDVLRELNARMDAGSIARLHDQYVDAWTRGDAEAAMAFWSDDIVMHALGDNAHAGVYRGKAEVRANLIDRIFAETVEAAVLGLVDRGIGHQHVFTIVHERFRKADGRVLDTKRILVYRWAHARIAEVFYVDPDQAGARAFWAR